MKKSDEHIKKALRSGMQHLDDQFTRQIVDIHLTKKQHAKNMSFGNFFSLIVGLSAVIAGIGLLISFELYRDWVADRELTYFHIALLLILSFVFLIFKWGEEWITTKRTTQ